MNKTLFMLVASLLLFPNMLFGQKAKAVQKLLKSCQNKAYCSAEQMQQAHVQVEKAVQQAIAKKARQQAAKSASVNWELGDFFHTRYIETTGFVFPFGKIDWRKAVLKFGEKNFKQVFARGLEELYPSGSFTLMLVPELEQVQEIFKTLWYKNGQEASAAVQKFLDDKTWYGRDYITVNGYIVAVVDGKQRPIKDVLFLDLKNKKWWSVNHSVSRANAMRHQNKLNLIKEYHPDTWEELNTVGFVLDTRRQEVSYDGIHWVPVSAPMLKQLKEWQRKNNFVLFTHKGLAVKRVFKNRAAYEAWKKDLRNGK